MLEIIALRALAGRCPRPIIGPASVPRCLRPVAPWPVFPWPVFPWTVAPWPVFPWPVFPWTVAPWTVAPRPALASTISFPTALAAGFALRTFFTAAFRLPAALPALAWATFAFGFRSITATAVRATLLRRVFWSFLGWTGTLLSNLWGRRSRSTQRRNDLLKHIYKPSDVPMISAISNHGDLPSLNRCLTSILIRAQSPLYSLFSRASPSSPAPNHSYRSTPSVAKPA